MKVTSAYANKLIKKLQEEKNFLIDKECKNHTYVAAVDEDPVIPEYDFILNTKEINMIDEKIANIRHAINFTNAVNTIYVNDITMTIDTALVKMAQLNVRKQALDTMRKKQPKARVNNIYNNKTIEYSYANYNIADAQTEYDRVSSLITAIQLELDKYNQTVLFEITE